MALNMVMPSNPCDPSPSWYPQRSRYGSHKRASSPDLSVPQSVRAKRLKKSATGHNVHSQYTLGTETTPPENAGRRASTEEWFEEISHDVPMTLDSDLIDNEPPFYLNHHGPSQLERVGLAQSRQSSNGSHGGPGCVPSPGMLLHETCGCSEEYRSVIDDLTVENRQLRQKLQKYERLHCSHLQQEKLFEVRIHGLPAHKKRDLERALREIAAGLDESTPIDGADRSHGHSSQQTLHNCKPPHPYPAPVDSAYASTLASEHTLNNRSVPNGERPEAETPSAQTRHQNVSSYLHDIPQCLMPVRSPNVSEGAKKTMVVSRLEQLFTGKSGAIDPSGFPFQPHGLPQSVAMGERRPVQAIKPKSCTEGAREAKILAADTDYPCEQATDQHSNLHDDSESRPSIDPQSNESDSPDQRPTRPMDLDMHQAQDGADNMKYIRHLGLDLPSQRPGLLEAEDGWVYLNLLINMAQLHTLNVTLDFVRNAIIDISSNLELSSDGQRVRWRGGTDKIVNSLELEDPHSSLLDRMEITNSSASPVKAVYDEYAQHRRPAGFKHASCASDLKYKPLFIHGVRPDDRSFLHGSDPEAFSDRIDGATNYSKSPNALRSFTNMEGSVRMEKDSGSIIFYSTATFCTDLSGNAGDDACDDIQYTRCTETPIGSSTDHVLCSGDEGNSKKLISFSRFEDAASDSRSNTPSDTDLVFPDIDALSLGSSAPRPQPVAFEASGLSGIQPGDNFVIDVQVQHAPNTTVTQGLGNRNTIMSSVKTDLEPSSLPPPSYVCLSASSSESGASTSAYVSEEDSTSDVFQQESWTDCNATRASGYARTPMPQSRESLGMPRHSGPKAPDLSIDLSSHARGSDPQTIAARGTDYENDIESQARNVMETGAYDWENTTRRGSSSADSMSVDGNWSSNDDE